jgi:hypothetical protein
MLEVTVGTPFATLRKALPCKNERKIGWVENLDADRTMAHAMLYRMPDIVRWARCGLRQSRSGYLSPILLLRLREGEPIYEG